jgi:hypothetical protein
MPYEVDRSLLQRITDPLIRQGVEMAISRTLLPALTERAYPGHFTVTANGKGYGEWNSWPGLDSWEMAGAYLYLGMNRVVEDYYDYVEASQRADGNVPFAIFTAAEIRKQVEDIGYSHARWPEDAFVYDDPQGNSREWVGLYEHWVKTNPLSTLAPICHILLGAEIHAASSSLSWLAAHVGSMERAAAYLLTQKSPEGFIGGAGFYVELPSRWAWDGITQCYSVEAFRRLAGLYDLLGRPADRDRWLGQARELTERFRAVFWTGRHFAEYLHPTHGAVDLRKLTDVDMAAIAFDLALPDQSALVWKQIQAEASFWHGDMPTRLTTLPFAYEPWELIDEFPPGLEDWEPTRDASGIGRIWFVDMLASLKRGDGARVVDAVRKVCRRGEQDGWLWYERYKSLPDGTAESIGPAGYCEYAAILVRIVLGNLELFSDEPKEAP